MTSYYNENDPIAAEVLRDLSFHEIIAPGMVDARSIKEIKPDDIARFTQCHFFAGAGTWSVAARLAGWPDDRPLWTASCPCQPFSVAGKGGGTDDPRHLWPDFFQLVRAVRPACIVGEQVGGAAGYGWFDGICADLESEGYTCRAVDIPASAVNAPHKRSRLYWVAVAQPDGGRGEGRSLRRPGQSDCADGERAHGQSGGPDGGGAGHYCPEWDGMLIRPGDPEFECCTCKLGDAERAGLEGHAGHGAAGGRPLAAGSAAAPDGGNYWADADWIICHDGKARRTKPGLRLLANGLAGRVHLWRLAGNSIVAPLAAEILKALMETLDEK